MKRMKRKHAINMIRVAGYHDDHATATRIYIENGVSMRETNNAFQEGERMRANGMTCDCYHCIQERK